MLEVQYIPLPPELAVQWWEGVQIVLELLAKASYQEPAEGIGPQVEEMESSTLSG